MMDWNRKPWKPFLPVVVSVRCLIIGMRKRSSSLMLGIRLLWTMTYRFLCEHKLGILWDSYLRLQLMGCMWSIHLVWKKYLLDCLRSNCIISHLYQQWPSDPDFLYLASLFKINFYFRDFDGCVVVSHYSLIRNFPLANDVAHFFHELSVLDSLFCLDFFLF